MNLNDSISKSRGQAENLTKEIPGRIIWQSNHPFQNNSKPSKSFQMVKKCGNLLRIILDLQWEKLYLDLNHCSFIFSLCRQDKFPREISFIVGFIILYYMYALQLFCLFDEGHNDKNFF